MATTKASPTDLLWAYQLKREHQYLLTRIQTLETAKLQQDTRIESAENASRKSRDTGITALAKQVEAHQHGGMAKRVEALEKRVAEKLDDLQAESEAVCLKVADVESTSERKIEEARRKAVLSEKAILKRFGELEIAVPKVEQKLEVLGERLNDGRVDEIGLAVDGLTDSLGKYEKEVQGLEDRVASVEHAQSKLENITGRLDNESVRLATEMAQRPVQPAAAIEVRATTEDLPQEVARPAQRPSKAGKKKATVSRPKKQPGDKERAAGKELAGLLESSTVAAIAPSKTSNARDKPALRRGRGWIVVERTPSVNMRPPAFLAHPIEDADFQPTTQASAAPRGRGRTAAPSKKRNFPIVDDEIEDDSQPSQSARQTRSQLTKKPRLDYNAKNATAYAMHSCSRTNTKQSKTAAPAKKGTAAKPISRLPGRPLKAAAKSAATSQPTAASNSASKYKTVRTKSPVPITQAGTVIESPLLQPDSPNRSPLSSPSPPQKSRPESPSTKPKPESSNPATKPQRPGRRIIQQADTWEEFERQCARVNV